MSRVPKLDVSNAEDRGENLPGNHFPGAIDLKRKKKKKKENYASCLDMGNDVFHQDPKVIQVAFVVFFLKILFLYCSLSTMHLLE